MMMIITKMGVGVEKFLCSYYYLFLFLFSFSRCYYYSFIRLLDGRF